MRLVIRYVLIFLTVKLYGCVGGEGEDQWKIAWTAQAMKASVVEKQGLEEKGMDLQFGLTVLHRFCKEYTSMEVNPSSAIT